MEFVGYVVKIGKCYLTSIGNYTISDCLSEAYVFKIHESAKNIAKNFGGTVIYVYVSDKKIW